MTVIDFASRLRHQQEVRALTQAERSQRIKEAALGMPWFPQDVDDDPYSTGLMQFSHADAERLAGFFDCFCVKVPPTALQPAILEAWDYLWKRHVKFADLKLRGTYTFEALTRQWSAQQHAFLDALLAGDERVLQELGQELGFFEDVNRILNATDLVTGTGPALEAIPPMSDAGGERYKAQAKNTQRPKRSGVVSLAEHARERTLTNHERLLLEDRPLTWSFPEFQPGPHYAALCFKFHRRIIEGQGYVWLESPEEHRQALDFFVLFGLDYNEYAGLPNRVAFDILHTLHSDAALHAILYLENPARFQIATTHLPAAYSRWIKAVALNQQLVVRRLAREGLAALLDSIAEHAAQFDGVPVPEDPAEQVSRLDDIRRPQIASEAMWWAKEVRDWGLEARVPYFVGGQIRDWPFPSFETDENGRSYIADADLHEQFSAILRAFGYEYRDVANDRELLEELSEVVVGALGQMVPEKRITKEQFERRFGQCLPALQRWVKACCAGRRETMLKLRDQVWPELKEWAKKNPPRKGKITAWGRFD